MDEEDIQLYKDAMHYIFLENSYTKEQAIDYIQSEIDMFSVFISKESIHENIRFDYLCRYEILKELLELYYN